MRVFPLKSQAICYLLLNFLCFNFFRGGKRSFLLTWIHRLEFVFIIFYLCLINHTTSIFPILFSLWGSDCLDWVQSSNILDLFSVISPIFTSLTFEVVLIKITPEETERISRKIILLWKSFCSLLNYLASLKVYRKIYFLNIRAWILRRKIAWKKCEVMIEK